MSAGTETKKRKRVSNGDRAHKATKASKKVKIEDAPKDSTTIERTAHTSATALDTARRGHWSLTDPIGGSFLNNPPIFSPDERFLLLANARSVHIYETSSSLLIRKLDISLDQLITSTTLSPSNHDRIYVSTASGQISLWDWTLGKKLSEWHPSDSILQIQACEKEDETSTDTIYTVRRDCTSGAKAQTNTQFSIVAHELGCSITQITSTVLLQTEHAPRSFSIYLGGRLVMANLGSAIAIGERTSNQQSDLSYTWRELPTMKSATCFDVWVSVKETEEAKGRKIKSDKPNVVSSTDSFNLAIGNRNGEIVVYEDVLSKLKTFENGKSFRNNTLPRSLHWHRRAVGSLRWSFDGRYIISGGQETVLCLWNVSNSKRSDLPHLVSPIEQIVVSPSGASYAVALADNSTIVLSTSEMKPTTSIAGLQSPALNRQSGWRSQTVEHCCPTPAALDPANPSQIVLAVPASQVHQVDGSISQSCPYIQRFDISTGRHMMRQAITRSNATNFVEAPNLKPIQEPNIVLMQLSHDGNYLATVDEWAPPQNDLTHTTYGKASILEEQSFRKEVNLKFWKLDHSTGFWRLVTRIDSPHTHGDGQTACHIFSLVVDPQHVGFATLGEDGFIKIWRPKTKEDNGKLVRGSSEGLIFWSLRLSIELEHFAGRRELEDETIAKEIPTDASLAFSTDGSFLAATQVLPRGQCQGLVHLINAETGGLVFSRAGLYAKGFADMGLLQRHLVILSHTLTVWDIVNDELVYSIERGALGDMRYAKRLSTNAADNTFAVSFASHRATKDSKEVVSKVMAFTPNESDPICSMEMPNPTMALFAARGTPGYLILDAAAEIRVLSPPSVSGVHVFKATEALGINGHLEEDEELQDAELAEDDIDEDGTELVEEPTTAGLLSEEVEDEENDRPVVRPEQLEEVFDVGPSFALPPVKDLFQAVVSLYARKTLGTVPEVS